MKTCPLCGKENKNRADICSSCGFNFSGTGHIPGGKRTREPLKEKKAGKVFRIIAICLAAILILTATGFFIHDLRTMKWHENFDPIIGISEGDILLYDLQRPSAKPLKIARIEDAEGVGEGYRKVYISRDRSTLAFSNGFEYYDDFFSVQCDVYAYNLKVFPYFSETVLRDVTDWTVSENFDILTFERASDGRVGLYQKKIGGEEKLITDKYRLYSVSADGRELVYSHKNKKLKTEADRKNANALSFSVAELTASENGGKITFSFNGADIQAELPDGLSLDESTLIITEKGSALISDESSGKTFLYKNNRFVLFTEEGEHFLIPDYPQGVNNAVNYDFSVLK